MVKNEVEATVLSCIRKNQILYLVVIEKSDIVLILSDVRLKTVMYHSPSFIAVFYSPQEKFDSVGFAVSNSPLFSFMY